MSDEKSITVAGIIIGAMSAGTSGAIVGGFVGAALQEFISSICPRCKNKMAYISHGKDSYYRCGTCKYRKSISNK